MNEEFLVNASHQLALITSLPFVHTARRTYRLDGLVRPSDRPRRGRPTALAERWEDGRTWLSRGSKSRNKVSVGEPAEGSLLKFVIVVSGFLWPAELRRICWMDCCWLLSFDCFITLHDGYLGSWIDEERSELRYVMRTAEVCESLNLWTHIALPSSCWEYACWSVIWLVCLFFSTLSMRWWGWYDDDWWWLLQYCRPPLKWMILIGGLFNW